jgi:hypothetical protein
LALYFPVNGGSIAPVFRMYETGTESQDIAALAKEVADLYVCPEYPWLLYLTYYLGR